MRTEEVANKSLKGHKIFNFVCALVHVSPAAVYMQRLNENVLINIPRQLQI